MRDWMDPTAVMASNPYLSLQQPAQPDKWSVLGNLLMGTGAGISQADAAGRGWASGIAPGLMAGWQMANALQKQAEDQSLRRAHHAMMLGDRAPRVEAMRGAMPAAAPKNMKQHDAWVPLGEGNGRMYMGPAYDPTKAYQRNVVTGEIRPVGSPQPSHGAGQGPQQPRYGFFNRQWR